VNNTNHTIRPGVTEDLDQLIAIEQVCFETDRLSKRSFLHFIKPGAHELLVIANEEQVLGYVLLLYRAGTNLARLYSIAVTPVAQGKGISKKLLNAAEQAAHEHRCAFMRLEVNVHNSTAISLYRKDGYKTIDTLSQYYDNSDDAFRMEKQLYQRGKNRSVSKPYYQQTTDFTCGPASLMMSIKTLRPDYVMSRHEELQIWREATTIFMTSGHGGCSPHGLALSAWHRGFDVTLYINQEEAPFLDGVRDEHKKAVIQLVHEDFLAQIKETSIRLKVHTLEADELDRILKKGAPIIALISTWRLNRNKAPHWVYVAGSDDEYVYINDSDISDDPHATETDYIQVPIDRHVFRDMARFGQKRLRCLLEITGPRKDFVQC
jgi:ribosomal protein S18 acetylase RimI-like enzyme